MKDIDLEKLLVPLFEKAKAVDEFEFGCAILRIRGTEGPGWDPLIESYQFMSQILQLLQTPIDEELKTRLFLSLYCHATEIDDIYIVVANLIKIAKGERCSTNPFLTKENGKMKKVKYPLKKITRIEGWAKDTEFENIPEVMRSFLIKEVRNAFYHSDYILYENNFNIRNGDGVLMNGIIDPQVPLDWLIPKLQLGINFALYVIGLTQKYRRSYKEEKVVSARILHDGGVDDMLLVIDPKQGLRGFRSMTQEEKEKMKLRTNL